MSTDTRLIYQNVYFDNLQDFIILYLHYNGDKTAILESYIANKIEKKKALGVLPEILFLDLYEAIRQAGDSHNIINTHERINKIIKFIYNEENKTLKNQMVILTSKFRISHE